MTLKELAQKLRPLIEKAAQSLQDAEAVEAVNLYPEWDGNGKQYEVEMKVRDEGILYSVLQAHTSQPTWKPKDAPSLFAKVLIPDPDVVPVWEQPDSTNPYMTGDRVHFPTLADPIYRSKIDHNVWSPADYPAGWEQE